MALTPEQQARLAELEKKFGAQERQPNALERTLPFTTGMVRGAVKKGAETTTVPLMRMLANAGLPWAQKEIEKVEAYNQTEKGPGEKFGGLAADVAMLSNPALKGAGVLARGAAAGAQGAAQHQAQNYGAKGEIDLGDAALETGITAATMGAGSKIPGGLKNTAAGYLQLLTRAPKRLERGMNPPTREGFKQALDEGIFPILKGGYRTAEKRGIQKQVARDAEKTGILDAAGVRGNAGETLMDAEAAIRSRSGGRRGLLPAQKGAGIKQLDQYRRAAKDQYYGSPVDMEPGKFIDLRKLADENANWVQGKTPEGLDLASQEFRRAAEDQLGKKITGKAGSARYGQLKDEMAELAPVLEAFNEKAVSNYSLGPELISTLLGVSTGNPLLALAPAARRVPQVAPALYETGRAAGTKTARRAGKGMVDLARSGMFSPGEDE